jgi:hypothetical protein
MNGLAEHGTILTVASRALVILLVTLIPKLPADAGMACWWKGRTICAISKAAGEADLCRTPSGESCRLSWQGHTSPKEVVLNGGVLFEVPDGATAIDEIVEVPGSFSESKIRSDVSSLLRVPAAAMTRRSAWFYSTDAKSGGGFDNESVADTGLCVTVGTSWGLARLKVSSCESGEVFRDASIAASDKAHVIPVRDGRRTFVAVVMTQQLPMPSSPGAGSLGFDGNSWFSDEAAEAVRE